MEMQKYMCCGCEDFVYEEANGKPDAGISPGTKWDDVPEDFVCTKCGNGKDEFDVMEE